jgi:lipoprotein-anchoring transpeptidase ErfK/SrfK
VARAEPVLYEWYGDDLMGPVSVNIVLDEQKAYIYRGGQPAGWTYLASGKGRYASSPGKYRITEKIVDKYSGTWGVIEDANGNVIDSDARAGREPVPPGGRWVGAPMPYWMRLTGYGMGLHAGHIPNPGYPASHGCIRLPPEMAEILHNVVVVGTPVTITGRTPG